LNTRVKNIIMKVEKKIMEVKKIMKTKKENDEN
jgi:hypothetical protein